MIDDDANKLAENSTTEQIDNEQPTSGHEFPAGQSVNREQILYQTAGFWIRLLAFSIDLIIICGLNSVLWNSSLSIEKAPSFIYRLLNINALFLGITGAAYFILMTYYFQQTLGKMIMGIKVVQRSGKPLGWTTVVFRELIARSLSQIMGLNLGYIVCWFNSEKRCAHDFLSDTWVVYERPPMQLRIFRS